MKRQIITLIILIFSVTFLTSCVQTYPEAKKAIERTEQKVYQLRKEADRVPPPVVTRDGYYVNTNPIALATPPAWLHDHITFQAADMPLDVLMSRVLSNTKAIVSYGPSVKRDMPITMDYNGSIKGALAKIASKTNYAYSLHNHRLNWAAFITKTFNISFMPGTSDYLVGGQAGAGRTQGIRGGGGGAGGSVATVRGNLGENQYSNLRGRLSVWDDLKHTLNELKSPDGKVIVSEATTTATVRDHPSNVEAMQRYITQLNKVMSEQVSIRVQVLELELKKEFNLGINWNVMRRALGTSFSLMGSLADATTIGGTVAGSGEAVAGAAGGISLAIGSNDNQAILNALSLQGKLSVVTQPTVMTLNNQIAEIRITRDTAYLESVSSTSLAGTVTGAAATTTLTPGIVTDGFTLYLLPKIKGNKVYLQISSTLSTLTALNKVSNQPTLERVSPDQRGDFQAIQVPTLDEKQFNQRAVLTSGSTLIVAGFRQLRDEIRKAGLFGTKIPGAAGAQSRNVETIVLITPVIIKQRN